MTEKNELHEKMHEIAERYVLMFDDEAPWGVAGMYAAASLELDFATNPSAYDIATQVDQAELLVQALQQYITSINEPICPLDATPLTMATTTSLGRASYCITCGKAVL